MDAIEAVRMNLSNGEKGMCGLLLFCLFGWFFGGEKADPTQCDIPTNSTELVQQLATVKESLAAQNHIADANKKVDPAPSSSDRHEKIKREVLVFVSKNCPPCERWKRCEMQKFLDAGWSVGIVEDHSYGITPTFEIESEGKKATRKGYTTLEQAAEALR